MSGLYSLFQRNKGKSIHKWIHYFPIYERYFSPYVNKSIIMLEIGVSKGGSMSMWRDYFGPYATIIGIDIDPACKNVEEKQCHVRIGSQSDTKFLGEVLSEFGTPDIVLDDGSHLMNDMLTSFSFLYPQLNNNGVYIVEDCHTCYWAEYGGALKHPDSFIEKAKDMIDTMNAYHYDDKQKVNDFTNTTASIAFYDSVVVFEKMRRTHAWYAPVTGYKQKFSAS